MNTPNHIPDDDDYYAFTAADNSESPSTVQVLIEDKLIDNNGRLRGKLQPDIK